MQIRSRGEVLGILADPAPDMCYLEARFTPESTAAAVAFVARARALKPRQTLADPTKAIRAELVEPDDPVGAVFLVMSLKGDRLFGRRVIDLKAIEWAKANVPE